MASSGNNSIINGFFKQKKKSITKPNQSNNKKSKQSYGSDVVQAPALHLQDDEHDDKEEEVLRQFDLNMAYGPCFGMSRLDRWNRANALGLKPPKQVEILLGAAGKANSQCLWDGRV